MIKRSCTSLIFESSVTACMGAALGVMLSRWFVSSDKDGCYSKIFSITGAIFYGSCPIIDYGIKCLDNYLGQDGINPDIE
jgi:hypothetical protein